jgi:hypothetical protein
MDTDPQPTATPLALHERLALSALVAGVTLWIRVVEVIPYGRAPSNLLQSDLGRAYGRKARGDRARCRWEGGVRR